MPRLHLAVLLVIAAFLGGCGPSDSDFVGVWKFDEDATRAKAKENMIALAKGEDEQRKARAGVDSFMAVFTRVDPSLDLKADKTGSMDVIMGDDSKNRVKHLGTWSRQDATASFVFKDGNQREEKGTGTIVQGKLHLQMDVPDKRFGQLVFRRG